MSTAFKDHLRELTLIFRERGMTAEDLPSMPDLFIHVFSGISDQRHQSYTKYRLENLLGICLVLAIMGRFTSFHGAETYVRLKPQEFIRLGLVKEGEYPSNDTFRRLFVMLDNREFEEETIGRIRRFFEKVSDRAGENSTPETRIISGDGQVVRGTRISHGDGTTDSAINMMNLYVVSSGLVLRSVPIDGKTNEIPVFQELLQKIDIKNAVITADAMHCQNETARIIDSRKGFYCFPVKENQSELREELVRIISKSKCEQKSMSNRDFWIAQIPKDRFSPFWPGARYAVRMVSHVREGRTGKPGDEMVFITSVKTPSLAMEAICSRWRIEDDLHRFKDMKLRQDEIQVREKNALRNMVTLNNVVYSLYRIAGAIEGRRMGEMMILYENEPMELLSKIYPLTIGNNFVKLVRKNMRGTKESKKA